RYRSVLTFGHLTICKFSNDVSGQKKLAARDYKDLLQCSIPCFDGLFPEEDNHIVIDTLFDFTMWHALAKSRMHTDSSLYAFKAVTSSLGSQLHCFVKTVCPQFKTKETPAEMAAQKSWVSLSDPPAAQTQTTAKSGKIFNLLTYKFHSLGDYCWTIPQFGTTDSYSTQIV
ncbi:hypothetical protein EDD18DRAFT_1021208, partial [Armillaria luteobubalina]